MGKDLKGKNLGRGFSQRPDGRYEARAVINGRKIDLYDKSLKDLKVRFEQEKTAVLIEETDCIPEYKLSQWYEEWFDKCKSKQLKNVASKKAYDRKMKHTYLKLLGDKKIEDVSQLDIQQASNDLSSEYSVKYLKESLGILRECYEIAIANGITSKNPVQSIYFHNGNEASKERRVLEHWEQDLFLEEIKDSFYEEAYKILLLTGMRIGEFSGLQWSDIDFQNKVIRISRSMMTAYQDGEKVMELSTPKTANSYREIPFFGNVEELFKAWKQKQELYKKKLGKRWRTDEKFGDLVFTNTMGAPITRYNLIHDLKRVENNIQLKEVTKARAEMREPRDFGHLYPHAFRHTFATRCFEKNLDPLVVQSIMGHSNYNTTVSYTHVLTDKKTEAVKLAGDLLN